jgi:hypothetical protein
MRWTQNSWKFRRGTKNWSRKKTADIKLKGAYPMALPGV